MFVTVENIAQYVPDMAGVALLASTGRISTAEEAATCINRMVINGDPRMNEANEGFKRDYSVKMSAPDVVLPVPNPAADGKRVSTIMREEREHSETFNHLFDENGYVI